MAADIFDAPATPPESQKRSQADDDLAGYIADNYGLCLVEPCSCRKDGWLGRGCPSWVPLKAGTWAELAAAQRTYLNSGSP